jgi:hypothetical protein
LENSTEHDLLIKSIKNTYTHNKSEIAEQRNVANGKKDANASEKAKNKFYYDNYKERILNQLENDFAFKPEVINATETQSNIVNTMVSARRRNMKMEDAYDYQKKKREM